MNAITKFILDHPFKSAIIFLVLGIVISGVYVESPKETVELGYITPLEYVNKYSFDDVKICLYFHGTRKVGIQRNLTQKEMNQNPNCPSKPRYYDENYNSLNDFFNYYYIQNFNTSTNTYRIEKELRTTDTVFYIYNLSSRKNPKWELPWLR